MTESVRLSAVGNCAAFGYYNRYARRFRPIEQPQLGPSVRQLREGSSRFGDTD